MSNIKHYKGTFGECDYDADMYTEQKFENITYLHYNDNCRKLPVMPKGYNSCYRMFEGTHLTEIDLSYLDTSEVKDFSYMFYYSEHIVNVVAIMDMRNAQNISSMFESCLHLQSVVMPDIEYSNLKDCSNLFRYCVCIRGVSMPSALKEKLSLDDFLGCPYAVRKLVL